MEEKLSQALVEEWIKTATGKFHLNHILEGQTAPESRAHLRVIMFRACKKGLAEAIGGNDGWYRPIEKELELMKLTTADPSLVLPLKFPFGLENYCKIFRKNVIILFGSKNAGKTTYLLNFANLNRLDFPIAFFNSDMGEEETRLRIDNFGDIDVEEWDRTVEMYERNHDFHDVIKPNYINIVDFLEVFDEFYRIGEPIYKMASKLDQGILIVAIQKNKGAEWGLGGQRAIEKAKMVINIDPGELILKVAKNWSGLGLTSSPRNKRWTFQIIGGAKFVNIRESAIDEKA